MVLCWKTMEQYTGINCLNPYSKELIKASSEDSLSNYAKSYLKAVCQFEKLYHMYQSAKNKKEVLITQKF